MRGIARGTVLVIEDSLVRTTTSQADTRELPVLSGFPMKIVPTVRMPLRTMSKCCFSGSKGLASQRVGLRGHSLKMFRVAASSIPAKMVKLESIPRQFCSDEQCVGDPVGKDPLPTCHIEVAISILQTKLPVPTGCGVAYIDPRPELGSNQWCDWREWECFHKITVPRMEQAVN